MDNMEGKYVEVERYEKYGRRIGLIVIRFGKYKRK
jgi:hypothetical protein